MKLKKNQQSSGFLGAEVSTDQERKFMPWTAQNLLNRDQLEAHFRSGLGNFAK
jgi:hypothetical protein